MNFKRLAKLRSEKGTFVLDFQDQVIDAKYIGWISEGVDRILDHLPRSYKPITEDDYILILEEGGECFLETREVRNMAKSWEGSAINSYTIEEPLYREEIVLIQDKMVLHFFRIEENEVKSDTVPQKLSTKNL